MRLVCPNCEAKYEVPEDAIPETGRDVQCANCGHAWFQMRQRAAVAAPVVAPVAAAVEPPAPPVHAPAPEPEPAPAPVPAPVEVAAPQPVAEAVADSTVDVAPVEEPVAEVLADPVPEVAPVAEPAAEVAETVAAVEAEVAETVAAAEAEVIETPVGSDVAPVADVPAAVEAAAETVETVSETSPEAEEDETEAPASAGAIAAAGVSAYAVDESVLAILREEAEREVQARKAEAEKLETQTELGIDGSDAAKAPAMVDPVSGDGMADSAAVRRTRLPDVEEINSTLRPAEVEPEAVDVSATMAEGRSSFRSGFLLVMTIAILGSALYGSADSIASAVPALAGVLKAYVGFVDSLRLHLDGLMQSATVAINGG